MLFFLYMRFYCYMWGNVIFLCILTLISRYRNFFYSDYFKNFQVIRFYSFFYPSFFIFLFYLNNHKGYFELNH
ncbi:hypothetical protein HANVADRAFT_84374 [Hanseniaspora valbyensis NRRL Y-1626]|uniref:Uncharacterized protein n=1 Tax=Hanseniaspora valbyensis NRRL Y-1626 TaxID=766949 RepID=A0A1B7TJD5_9ASCO|nr:hypothetical protein HANVADRAFT_84374 [Hanseniaspora valbyensis NRRL Y-1626]